MAGIQGTGSAIGTHSWTEGNPGIAQHLPLPTENKLSLGMPKPIKDFFRNFKKEKLTVEQVKNRQDLSGEDLSRLNLAGINLKGKNLKNTNLYFTNLERANLEGANLEGANLTKAKLKNANLKNAHLRKAILLYADMQGVNVKGANMKGVKIFTDQLKTIGGLGDQQRTEMRPIDQTTYELWKLL